MTAPDIDGARLLRRLHDLAAIGRTLTEASPGLASAKPPTTPTATSPRKPGTPGSPRTSTLAATS